MKGYAFDFKSHGVFTPEGEASDLSPSDVESHNARLTAEELAHWQMRPDRRPVYVIGSEAKVARGYTRDVQLGDKVTTWTGETLGTITYVHTYPHNFGSHMTAIRFQGTNGAEYYGRYGSDWSELCWARRVKAK